MEDFIRSMGSWEPAVWAAVIAGGVALVGSGVALANALLTRKSAAADTALKTLQEALATLRAEVTRLEAKVDQITKETTRLAGRYRCAVEYIRRLRKQLRECSVQPAPAPSDIMDDIT